MSKDRIGTFLFALWSIAALATGTALIHAQPTVSQSYGLTLERDDFIGSQGTVSPSGTAFSTAVAARSSFALIFRNGLLQRPGASCATPPPAPCDYTPSGNLTATFPPNVIQPSDTVTLIFQR